jgi:hypothetical protein
MTEGLKNLDKLNNQKDLREDACSDGVIEASGTEAAQQE